MSRKERLYAEMLFLSLSLAVDLLFLSSDSAKRSVWVCSNTPGPNLRAILNRLTRNLVNIYYTLRGFGGRGPLNGTGVLSSIEAIIAPLFATNERIAESRPAPTPFTIITTSLRPISLP